MKQILRWQCDLVDEEFTRIEVMEFGSEVSEIIKGQKAIKIFDQVDRVLHRRSIPFSSALYHVINRGKSSCQKRKRK